MFGLVIKFCVVCLKVDVKLFVMCLLIVTNLMFGVLLSVDKSLFGCVLCLLLCFCDFLMCDYVVEGLVLIEFEARGVVVSVSSFGATIVSLRAARRGDVDEKDDVVFGFDDCESYDEVEGRLYFGVVCGWVVN